MTVAELILNLKLVDPESPVGHLYLDVDSDEEGVLPVDYVGMVNTAEGGMVMLRHRKFGDEEYPSHEPS